MYIRNLRKPSANKNVSKFASQKNRQSILGESPLERDCCLHLEYDTEVIAYESQPKGFYYELDGKKLPYTPDFLVHYVDGSRQFVEVKPYKFTLSLEFKREFKQKKIAAESTGIQLILVTDKQIRTGYYLKNCELIHRYSGCIDGDSRTIKVLGSFKSGTSIKVRELASFFGVTFGTALAMALRLVSLGKLSVDLDSSELNEHSVFMVV